VSVVTYLDSIVAWGYGVGQQGLEKIKDNRGFRLIINGFIAARPDKIRLSWLFLTIIG
jgi:hypothetical protein